MNWSHCSRALVVALLVLAAAVAPAAAVATSEDGVPTAAAAGSEVTATYTFTELYTEYESWTLHGETELTDVTWTVRQLDQAENQVSQNSYDGRRFDSPVDIAEDTAKVIVKVTGTVPEVETFSYDPSQQFTFARFQLRRQGGTRQNLAADRVHHYTGASKTARDEIDQARRAIDAAGGDRQAEQSLRNAISAYDGGNFQLAAELADEAESRAERARSNRNRTQLLLFGGIGVAALSLVVGGVFYYRSRQDTYDKLR